VTLPIENLRFQISNAKVGQAYAGRITTADAMDMPGAAEKPSPPDLLQLRLVQSAQLDQLVATLGLQFHAESHSFSGIPLVAGEYRIQLEFSRDGVQWLPGQCVLIITPDPRKLWKVLEPAIDAPYPKQHLARQMLTMPQQRIIAASRRGRSHEHVGSFRDDDFFIAHDTESGWSVILVADGAGSACHSRCGAKLAVTTLGAHLLCQLGTEESGTAAKTGGKAGDKITAAMRDWAADPASAARLIGTEFHYLFHQGASLAVQAIEAEALKLSAQVKDYATTLLAAAIHCDGTETFIATFWIGDGAIAAYGPRGKIRLMGTPDSGEYAGQTRFLDRAALSDPSFSRRIGIGRYTGLVAVFLMTDGVSDPCFETDNGLADGQKWDALWDQLAPCLAASQPDQSLLEWLHFFTPGHHDDRTLALLIPTPPLP
jgi:hypothetical protein